MNTDTKLGLAVLTVALAIFGSVFLYHQVLKAKPSTDAGEQTKVVRSDSHRLGPPSDSKVTVVEFLDFECEACRAAYPIVEQLRTKYEGRVTFVARYFPLPSHRNAKNAAHAVEAAARQGAFEKMHQRMFQTQATWGEQQDSQAPLFRSYAQDLGLDMTQYDRDVNSSTVAQRVQKDIDDGVALGVTGTPTFFLNGKKVTLSSTQDLVQAIEGALAK